MPDFVYLLDLIGVAVFAATGAVVAADKRLDPFGFALVGTVTGIGGGTLRDLLLGRPVFWIAQNEYVVVCVLVTAVLFVVLPHLRHRHEILLWADAIGLSVFAALGARIALDVGASPIIAVVMGVMTGCFGGVARDVICNEIPLILHREIYATAAAGGACALVIADHLGLDPPVPGFTGLAVCLLLRGLGIAFGVSVPAYGAGPREPTDS